MPPEVLGLTDSDVHVWKASLDLAPMSVQGFAVTLSEDERVRAGRFAFERDRIRFVVCRGVLRAILGRYLGAAPGSLEFSYGPYGKPALSIGSGGPPLRFNISHADGIVLYAVTVGREVGIDLERIRPDFATDEIAERFFSSRELATLRRLSRTNRTQAFFRCWTLKEAYIKAKGEGLTLPLEQFDVSVDPDEPVALLSTRQDPQDALRWSLRDLPLDADHIAAIAVEGHGWRLYCWQAS